jgi:hypothetical protein
MPVISGHFQDQPRRGFVLSPGVTGLQSGVLLKEPDKRYDDTEQHHKEREADDDIQLRFGI